MDEMRKLVDLLNRYAKEYYVLDAPTVSDKEYDALYDKLVKRKKKRAWYCSIRPREESAASRYRRSESISI